jgi:hypothetical protein
LSPLELIKSADDFDGRILSLLLLGTNALALEDSTIHPTTPAATTEVLEARLEEVPCLLLTHDVIMVLLSLLSCEPEAWKVERMLPLKLLARKVHTREEKSIGFFSLFHVECGLAAGL